MSRLHELWRDRSGAILVKGLVMAPILAAGLWYETVAWESAISREFVQTAADVTAVGGAAWLSGGMNILALINVIMSFILTAFIVIRVVEILCLAGAIFFFGLSFVPFCQWALGVSRQAAQWGEKAFEKERQYAPKIMRALNWGTSAERMVARGFPYISTAMSATMAGGGGSGSVSGGLGVSLNFAMTPTGLDKLLDNNVSIGGSRGRAGTGAGAEGGGEPREPLAQVDTFPERMGRLETTGAPPNASMQQRLRSIAASLPANLVGSLPVEDEGYAQLCSRASSDWTNFALVRDLPFMDKLEMVLSFLGGNLTSLMCQPFSEAKDKLKEKIEEEGRKALENEAERRATEQCDRLAAEGGQTRGQRRHPNRTPAHQRANCIRGRAGAWRGSEEGRRFRADYERDRRDELDRAEAQMAENTDTIKTAKIWSLISDKSSTVDAAGKMPEVEANLFLSTYGIYKGAELRERNVGKVHSPAVRALAGLAPGDDPASDLSRYAFQTDWSSARGRFYFDCTGSSLTRGNGEDGIHSCADNSMWRPGGWTWALGRDRSPISELGETGRQALTGYLGYLTGEIVQTALGRVLQPLLARGSDTRLGWTGDRVNDMTQRHNHWATRDAFSTWIQRIGATAVQPGRERIFFSHGADWWVGNNVGDNAYNLWSGSGLEYGEFYR